VRAKRKGIPGGTPRAQRKVAATQEQHPHSPGEGHSKGSVPSKRVTCVGELGTAGGGLKSRLSLELAASASMDHHPGDAFRHL
jgi:hypothetical protein